MDVQAPKKITAIIPCYNEEAGIGEVIKSFPVQDLRELGFELEILVIDNNSSDNTTAVARSLGAHVLHERRRGKGYAMRLGFKSIPKNTDYVVMIDGDATYRPEEILQLIVPLHTGASSVVLGSRLKGRIEEGSMNTTNWLGNVFFSHLVRVLYRIDVTDTLTGYFAWKREAIERLRSNLTSEGFTLEMEMVTKMAKLGERIQSVPISYVARAGKSSLRPLYDGSRILWVFFKNLFWQPESILLAS